MRTLSSLALVAALAGAVHAQASFTNYGRGCNLPGQAPPLIRATGLPQIGTAFTVTYIGPNSITPVSTDQPVLLTGFQQASVPIPLITSLQPAGCTLLVAAAFAIPMPLSGTAYQDRLTVQIPNDAGLIGATYYQQWAGLYSRCGASCVLGMVRMSDAAAIVVGT